MARQGRGSNQHQWQASRKLSKQAEKRRPHTDKYAGRSMENKLRQLADHFNSEERDDERQ